jgi:hypothetical protein
VCTLPPESRALGPAGTQAGRGWAEEVGRNISLPLLRRGHTLGPILVLVLCLSCSTAGLGIDFHESLVALPARMAKNQTLLPGSRSLRPGLLEVRAQKAERLGHLVGKGHQLRPSNHPG